MSTAHWPGAMMSGFLATLLIGLVAPRALAAPVPALDACWSDLDSTDEARALRAVLALGQAPDGVAFLQRQLRPAFVELQALERRLDDLDHESFARRQQATQELEDLGELALPHLRRLLNGRPPLEVRRRAELLVERINQLPKVGERPRTQRALAILVWQASPAARTVLKGLARGDAQASLTIAAQAALDRFELCPSPLPTGLDRQFVSNDDGKVARVLLVLARAPRQALPVVEEKVVRWLPAPVDPREVARLLTDLDSDDKERKRLAADALNKLGDSARPALQEAATDDRLKEHTRLVIKLVLKLMALEATQTELRFDLRRIEHDLLDDLLPGAPAVKPLPSLTVLARRAEVLLEHLDAPEARTLLETLRTRIAWNERLRR
ncbi:MAG: hypothetical protein JNM56_33370 [Planctomycetia bacterium]|nr:hypothetical protein [Planctomycetia bacterium]